VEKKVSILEFHSGGIGCGWHSRASLGFEIGNVNFLENSVLGEPLVESRKEETA